MVMSIHYYNIGDEHKNVSLGANNIGITLWTTTWTQNNSIDRIIIIIK